MSTRRSFFASLAGLCVFPWSKARAQPESELMADVAAFVARIQPWVPAGWVVRTVNVEPSSWSTLSSSLSLLHKDCEASHWRMLTVSWHSGLGFAGKRLRQAGWRACGHVQGCRELGEPRGGADVCDVSYVLHDGPCELGPWLTDLFREIEAVKCYTEAEHEAWRATHE